MIYVTFRGASFLLCISSFSDGLVAVLQCVAACCSVMQCVAASAMGLSLRAVCCSVAQSGAVCKCDMCHFSGGIFLVAHQQLQRWSHHYVAVCCSVLQCVAVCCSVVRCGAVWRSVAQCGTVCCSALHCIVWRCSVLKYVT